MIFKKIIFFLKCFYEMLSNALISRRICETNIKLENRVVVITGANTGIGKETAYKLSLKGARIIIGCRDLMKGETAINEIKAKNPLADITVVKLDLSSLTSVRMFVKSVSQMESKLDLLINNAGIYGYPEWKTCDGFEINFGTNYLGHFLLTLSLIPLLKNSSNARVINISSMSHMLGEIQFNDKQLIIGDSSRLKAYSSRIINTKLTRNNSNILTRLGFFINMQIGAQTTLYCALEESIEFESGSYYDNCKRVDTPLAKSKADEIGAKLWKLSCDLVQLEQHLRI